MNDNYMSLKGLSEYLGIHEISAYRLMNKKNNKFPGRKVGGQWRFRKDLVDKYFEKK